MNQITLILFVIVVCLFCLTSDKKELFGDSSVNHDFIMDNSTIIKINNPWKHLLTDNICRWPGELLPIKTLNMDHLNVNHTPANTNRYSNNTYCGGIDNYCSSNYDCCNGLYCRKGTCQI